MCQEEGVAVRGLGEAMKMRPAWKVQLPKGVKAAESERIVSVSEAWPVFEEPSRNSKGKKPLEELVLD